MHRTTIKFLPSFLLFSIQISLFAQLVPQHIKVDRSDPINYFLYTPVGNEQAYPLVVFLHGGGEGGSDIELVKKHGIPKLISEGLDFPFYVFAPQNPSLSNLWDDQMVEYMVDKLIDSLSVDINKIYLVGMSRGGNGIWRMAINNPSKYAAIISVCAASIPTIYLNRLSSLPVWFFHGEKDTVVPVEETIRAYELMRKETDKVKITLYPEANHDSWTETFENQEIYTWLVHQRLK